MIDDNHDIPSTDLRQLQIIQLEMLLEVDRICREHSIKYSIAFGTLLGAVRHKGFIPWDDDLDIFMIRAEYERFCKVCESALDEKRFYMQTHNNTPGYRWGYGKIRRIGTEYIRKGQEYLKYPMEVSIDIFPLDNVPNNKFMRPFYHFSCFIIRKLLWAEAGKKSDRSRVKRIVYSLLSRISKEAIFKLYDGLRAISGDTEQVRIITFPNYRYRGHDRKWYTDLTHIEFEGFSFPAPKAYHDCLTYKYGDYKKLPPLEKQKGHHQAVSYKLLEVRREELNSIRTDTNSF